MKKIPFLLLLFPALSSYSVAYAQQTEGKQNQLSGKAHIRIDVSHMQDTSGKFMLMIGGSVFYPYIQGNMLLVDKDLEEPRRSFLAFFPKKKMKENPGKPLNEIAAEVSDYFNFLAVPGTNKIIVQESVAGSEIAGGTRAQKDYFSLLKLKNNFEVRIEEEYAPLLNEIKNEKKPTVKDSLLSLFYSNAQKEFPKYYRDTILGFVRDNPDSPASLVELEEYSHEENKDLKLFSFLYNNLSDRMKALPTAKRIYGTVDAETFAADSLLGRMAPNFSQNNPAGKTVSLSDFKGHVTLLEFWASWCGPCRASNPALVKIFNKYSNKGFKILGVSLDDKRDHWLKAIKDDHLTWEHTSDLKFFNNSVAVLYHINSIPSNYLIDSSGKIVACNLDEKRLTEQLEKLLN